MSVTNNETSAVKLCKITLVKAVVDNFRVIEKSLSNHLAADRHALQLRREEGDHQNHLKVNF